MRLNLTPIGANIRCQLVSLLLLASIPAYAETTLRVENKVLVVGNSAVRVLALMGQPALREFYSPQASGLPDNQLASGELWQYEKDGKTIITTIVGGRVRNIQTLDE